MPAAPQKPTVYISYAHESDELRAAVKALAHWLEENGCDVLTDHEHENRSDAVGWLRWMQGGISKADVVLIVCTPKLKARFEGSASPDEGHGVIWESNIIMQYMYDNGMRNEKCYPISPDGGSLGNIPDTLKPWWNKHFFPSGQPAIRDLIFEVCKSKRREDGPPKEPTSSLPAVFIFGSPDEKLSDSDASDCSSLIDEMSTSLGGKFDEYILNLGDGWNQFDASLENIRKIREFRERDHKIILAGDSAIVQKVAVKGRDCIIKLNRLIDDSFPDDVKPSNERFFGCHRPLIILAAKNFRNHLLALVSSVAQQAN